MVVKCGTFTISLRKDMIIRLFSSLYILRKEVRHPQTTLSEFVSLLVESSAQNVPEVRMSETRSSVFWMKNAASSAARGWYRLRGHPLRGTRMSDRVVWDWSYNLRNLCPYAKETRNIISEASSKVLAFCSKSFRKLSHKNEITLPSHNKNYVQKKNMPHKCDTLSGWAVLIIQ